MSERRADIELVFFEGCPNADAARENLSRALTDAGWPDEWKEWDLEDEATPADRRGYGSPTVLVDGQDVLDGPSAAGGRSCRAEGAPTVEAVRKRLEAAK